MLAREPPIHDRNERRAAARRARDRIQAAVHPQAALRRPQAAFAPIIGRAPAQGRQGAVAVARNAAADQMLAVQPLNFAPGDVYVNPAMLDEMRARITNAAYASATDGWVAHLPLGATPPVRVGPVNTSDYMFQRFVDGQPRDWRWIVSNTTMFYQANGATYYLRMRMYHAGVDDVLWRRLVGDDIRSGVRNSFRTFELIDVTGGGVFQPLMALHRDHSIYYEVDFLGRTLSGKIDVPVGNGDDRDTLLRFAMEYVRYVQQRIVAHEPVPSNKHEALIAVILEILHIYIGNSATQRRVSVSLSYETPTNNNDVSLLLSSTETMDPAVDIVVPEGRALTTALAWDALAVAVFNLFWKVRQRLLVAQYQENNLHLMHPRSVRVLLNDDNMPDDQGMLYSRAPNNFRLPRGGCLSVSGMPKSLMKCVKGLIGSSDVHRSNMFVDNNCGIREALIALGARLHNPLVTKPFYKYAAALRANTPGIPPFVRLTPEHVCSIIWHHFGPLDVSVFELPSPQKTRGKVWDYYLGDPTSLPSIQMAVGAGHYFGLLRTQCETNEEYESMWETLKQIRYCRRCNRYIDSRDSSLRTHDWGMPSEDYPACSVKRPELHAPLADGGGGGDEYVSMESGVRRLVKCVVDPPHKVTNNDHVGLMDLETWRPYDKQGYHEVYAVGWIVHAKEGAQASDVKLYSSADDVAVPNAALVHAFVDLIALLCSDTSVYSASNPYYLYLYNGSGFDNLFILHTLTTHFAMLPEKMTMKDGRLLTMSYLEGALIVRDLCLFTLCSLDSACKVYNVEDELAKGKFDHSSITSLAVVAEKWTEISEYLSKDLTALNAVFIRFKRTCYEVFQLDPCKRLTMSQLSYDYWNSTLSAKNRSFVTLPSSYDQYQDILRSYYGGRVYPQVKEYRSVDYDVPYSQMEDYLVDLDVVSLYPSAMWYSKDISDSFFPYAKRNIPLYFCGKPSFHLADDLPWIADVFKLRDKYEVPPYLLPSCMPSMDFWRCEAPILLKVGAIVCVDFEANQSLLVPILPHKNENCNTSWDLLPHQKQWYVLEEILDALYYGYRVTKLHCAYVYPVRAALFDDAMDTLMAGKKACQRGDPKRDQYKLGANSIYGKHAQKAITEDVRLVEPSALKDVVRESYVLSVEPVVGEQHMPSLIELRQNRPRWVNNDPHVAEALDNALHDEHNIPVRAFVVKTKPDVVQTTKPTYLGSQVTAFSRIHMNWFIHTMGLMDSKDPLHQVFYTDTDSLIVHSSSTRGHDKLFGSGLGMLDDELQGGRIIDYVALAPKTYALVYKMPDETLWMKVRCKGFPHNKNAIPFDGNPPLDAAPGDMEKLELGERVYEVTSSDGTSTFYKNLSPSIFRGVLHKEIAQLTVHFTTMRRCYFGVHALGHVAGIKHCSMKRSISSAVWWDGCLNSPVPKHRVTVAQYPGLTFPIGHSLLRQ